MLKYVYLGNDIPPLHTYNLFLGIGIIAFFLSLEKVFKRNAISFQKADEIKGVAFYVAIFGVLGAALGEAFYHRKGIEINFSGYTFYGGLLAAIFSLWVFAQAKNLDFLNVANILSAPLALGHAFGRIGCFLGGCCYGTPTNSVLGVVFPEGSLPHELYGAQAVHPIQLYESLLLILLGFALMKTEIKWRFAVYLLAYSIFRFVIEYFRGDDRGALLFDGLSPSQEISMILFLGGIVILHNISRWRSCCVTNC